MRCNTHRVLSRKIDLPTGSSTQILNTIMDYRKQKRKNVKLRRPYIESLNETKKVTYYILLFFLT